MAAGTKCPGVRTSQRMRLSILERTFRWMTPLSTEADVPLGDVLNQAVVVDIDRIEFLAARSADGKFHSVANLQIELRSEIACADRGPLGVEQDTDGASRVPKQWLGSSGRSSRTQSCLAMAHVSRKLWLPG